jgi:hypothetical protein
MHLPQSMRSGQVLMLPRSDGGDSMLQRKKCQWLKLVRPEQWLPPGNGNFFVRNIAILLHAGKKLSGLRALLSRQSEHCFQVESLRKQVEHVGLFHTVSSFQQPA